MKTTENEKMMEDFLHIGHMLRRKRQPAEELLREGGRLGERESLRDSERKRHSEPPHDGSSPPWYRHRVLRIVGGYPEGIPQNRIATDLGIRPQSLSELLAKLETEELIHRCKNPEDKRETLVFLTEKGRIRHEAAEKERRSKADAMMSALTEDECRELRRLLDKILNVVDGETWKESK